MPATKSNIWAMVNNPKAKSNPYAKVPAKATVCLSDAPTYPGSISAASPEIHFPTTELERREYRTSTGKKLTSHQWNVYDYTLRIPIGRVSTYKAVCEALGQGSPRSVGSALRNNPFAPYVPCHRVIASNLYLGGFYGEWGPDSKASTQFGRKLDILAEEGVAFDLQGMLKSSDQLWQLE